MLRFYYVDQVQIENKIVFLDEDDEKKMTNKMIIK